MWFPTLHVRQTMPKLPSCIEPRARCMAGSHTVAIYRYLPWRLVTSCESHSTVRTTVHVLYGAEMAIELQWHGGETAVRWEAQRWMETEGILFGQLDQGGHVCQLPTPEALRTKILIKSLKPHNLIPLVVHSSSQIFKMILIVGITQACTVLRASPRVPYFVFQKHVVFQLL